MLFLFLSFFEDDFVRHRGKSLDFYFGADSYDIFDRSKGIGIGREAIYIDSSTSLFYSTYVFYFNLTLHS
jgi:hypothetical protein